MPILAQQDDTLCKERFFWGVTFSAVKQTIFTVIIFCASNDRRKLRRFIFSGIFHWFRIKPLYQIVENNVDLLFYNPASTKHL